MLRAPLCGGNLGGIGTCATCDQGPCRRGGPRLAWGRPAPPAACQRPKHRVNRRWTVYDAHTGTRVRAP